MARRFHRNNIPALFLKLDIAKAFDSVRWDYLLILLEKMGFPTRWRDWIAALLFTSSSRIMLNGIPNRPISHGRGLRQGDPLSPLLFVIAIEPLRALLHLATEKGLISKLRGRSLNIRVSMYADDTAIFVNPIKEDIGALTELLNKFGEASGLKTNFKKSSVVPIRCEGIDLDYVLGGLPIIKTNFPIKYLGLPLTTGRLKRVHFQPIIDKAIGKLTAWNARNIAPAGRLTLVKAVLTSQSVYLLTALDAPKAILEEIDIIRKRFFWAGAAAITGGKCKVNWVRSARPTQLGGLGILNLKRFARSLRLRWLWQEWKEFDKPWIGSEIPCNETDKKLFAAATTITVGNGSRTSFWHCGWFRGQRPIDFAPNLFMISRKKSRMLGDALRNNNWIKDLNFHHPGFSLHHLREFVDLWKATQTISLNSETQDEITWKFLVDGNYSARSAYNAQFIGSTITNFDTLIWQSWAPATCKIFSWLAVQNRLWTADRLQARGWPNQSACPLCRCQPETAMLLLAGCRFTRKIWSSISKWLAIPTVHPREWTQQDGDLHEWWTAMARAACNSRKGVCSLIMLISWEIWKERNARIFDRKEATSDNVFFKVRDDLGSWVLAGAKDLATLAGRT